MLYVDTSVLVTALTLEPSTYFVQSWLAHQPAGFVAVSDWTRTEFSSALARKLVSGIVTNEEKARAMATIEHLSAGHFLSLGIGRSTFAEAGRLAERAPGLRAGDALHAAICAETRRTMCTLDRRLSAACTALGIDVLDRAALISEF